MNNIYLLSDQERNTLRTLEEGKGKLSPQASSSQQETLEEVIQKERVVLLGIQGIKEVILLDNADRSFIFDHEEDRNHGVYESLKKKVLFAVTHDGTFRDPDEAIVFKK